MQKAAFEALQVKKDLMHRQIRNQVRAGGAAPTDPFLRAFPDSPSIRTLRHPCRVTGSAASQDAPG